MLTPENVRKGEIASFIRSDDEVIRFIRGWYNLKNSWPYKIKTIKEFAELVIPDHVSYPRNYRFFVNKLVVFNYFYEVMREHCPYPIKWHRVLDIGTGPAIHPRLMKGVGMCNEAWGIDVLDRSNDYPDALIKRYITNFRKYKWFPKTVETIERVSRDVSDTGYTIHTPFTAFPPNPNLELKKYIVSDFMDYDFGNQKFDCITAIMCIEYFDTTKLFEKVSSILRTGGLFFVIVDNWYELFGGSMHLPMDTPWLHARVSTDDLIRYYEEVRPDISPYAKQCMYVVRSHMTPTDYAMEARKAKMHLMSYRRGRGAWGFSIENVLFGGGLEAMFYNEILPQAQSINPSVMPSDFLTSYLTLVMVKK